ncbi:MAG: hypothetical protein ACRD1H_04645 [Vicinamibacterales bacterium]
MQLAIPRLSDGDVDKLLHFVNAAIMDDRDVLWWSKMPLLSNLEPE